MVRLILALFFALCVAIFAVINVTPAPIHYLFGVRSVPLVLIILGAACFGGLIVGLLGAVAHFRWRHENRVLKATIAELEQQIEHKPDEINDEVGTHPSHTTVVEEQPNDSDHPGGSTTTETPDFENDVRHG